MEGLQNMIDNLNALKEDMKPAVNVDEIVSSCSVIVDLEQDLDQDLKQDSTCCICLESFQNGSELLNSEKESVRQLTPCNHCLHDKCIRDLVKSRQFSCPLCRTEFYKKDDSNLIVEHMLDVALLIALLMEEEQRRRRIELETMRVLAEVFENHPNEVNVVMNATGCSRTQAAAFLGRNQMNVERSIEECRIYLATYGNDNA
jgi:hypothetical protein